MYYSDFWCLGYGYSLHVILFSFLDWPELDDELYELGLPLCKFFWCRNEKYALLSKMKIQFCTFLIICMDHD